ncbi:hypothetical protein DFQ30_010800 [Apophysomyces sp. BC1015]|nr:hypothetical protein DFQ30_010800 [Apophysomyces sp. BC1015]
MVLLNKKVLRLFRRQSTKQRPAAPSDHDSRKNNRTLSRLWAGRRQQVSGKESITDGSHIFVSPCLANILSEKLEVDTVDFIRSTSATSSSTSGCFWEESTISTACTSLDGESVKHQRFSIPQNITLVSRDLSKSQMVNKSAHKSRRMTTSCIGLAEQVRFVLGDAIFEADRELEDQLAL